MNVRTIKEMVSGRFGASGLLSLWLLLSMPLWAQSRPDWLNEPMRDLSANSYIKVVKGEGGNYETSRNEALRNAIAERGLSVGMAVKLGISADGSISVVDGGKEIRPYIRVLDDYNEYVGDRCVFYLLIQVGRYSSDYDPVKVTDRYPFSGREFVPGMAQIYKGQVGKGVGFIVGEVAFIGGIVASECLRASYVSKMNATRYVKQRKIYADNANICALSRNISIAGAAAIYVWNIIDGAVAKGRKHVLIGDARLQFAPYATPETSGLALSLTF